MKAWMIPQIQDLRLEGTQLRGSSGFGWSRGVDKQLNIFSSSVAALWSLGTPLLTIPSSSYSFVPMVSAWAHLNANFPAHFLMMRLFLFRKQKANLSLKM